MPASSALWMMRIESSWSGLPMAVPNIMRAERVGADLDAGPAEGAVLHGVLLRSGGERCRCRTLNLSGKLFRNYTERLSGYASEEAYQ